MEKSKAVAEYKFKNGGGPFPSKYKGLAQVAASELTAIEKEHGRITPELLLERSESADSPLHQCFTWDDTKAGHKWRMQEARSIIRAVVVERADEDTGSVVRVPVFINSEDENGNQGYFSLLRVLNSEQMLNSSIRDLTKQIGTLEDIVQGLLDLSKGNVPVARKVKKVRRKVHETKLAVEDLNAK